MSEIIKGKLKNGFEFAIPSENFGKWRTLQLLKETKTAPWLILDVVPRLLGEQTDAFIDAIGEDPTFDEVAKAIEELFTIVKKSKENNAAKKSSSLPT